MNAFATTLRLAFGPFLWKEWRDHRAIVIAIAIALPLLTLLFAAVVPASIVGNTVVPSWAAAIAFGIVAISLYGDLFAGEERRGTIAFLRRQPGGVWPPFIAKFVFLALVTVVICGGETCVAALVIDVIAPATPATFDAHRFLIGLLFVLLVPAWSIAFSIWFPRSAVALPGAAVVLALFVAPIALACAFNLGLEPTTSEVEGALIVLILAAPLVAALSFARGAFVERPRWRAAVVGLLATLGLFTPAYAWTAVRVVGFRSLDPTLPTLRIEGGVLSVSGRFAYANAFHAAAPDSAIAGRDPTGGDGPLHALRIDLATGEWRELAGAGTSVYAAPHSSHSSLFSRAAYLVLQTPTASSTTFERDADWLRAFPILDAESGARCASERLLPFITGRSPAGRRQQRISSAIALANGSHAWIEDGHIVRSTTEGTTRVLPDSALPPDFSPNVLCEGCGVWLAPGDCYDVSREQRFRLPDADRDSIVRWIRHGSWIVGRRDEQGRVHYDRYDPVSRLHSPIVGLEPEELLCSMVTGERLLIRTRPSSNPRHFGFALLDPDRGTRETIEPPPLRFPVESMWMTATTPSGSIVLTIRDLKGRATCLARLDVSTLRIDVAAPDDHCAREFVGCVDDESVIVSDGRRLLRQRFGASGSELLFPRAPSR